MTRRYDLVVFDLDGTLVDSLPDIAAALNHALALHGQPALHPEVVRTLVGEGVHVLASRALAAVGARDIDPGSIANAVQGRYLEDPCGVTTLYDGVPDVLAHLAETGHQTAVLTNKPGPIARALLQGLGVSSRFVAIVGDGDGHPRKPSPDALRSLAARGDVALSRVLMVGDGLPDMAVAAATPCDKAAALWGYTPAATLAAASPTFALDRPRDLLRALPA